MDDWKDIFKKYLLSHDPIDYDSAFNIKNSHIPAKLYRYRPLSTDKDFDRLCELISLKPTYFPTRDKLNDPFELIANFSSEDPNDYLVLTRAAKDEYRKILIANNNYPTNDIENAFKSEDYVHELIKLQLKKSKFDEYCKSMEKEILMVLEKICLNILKPYNRYLGNYFLASFTEEFTNLPLWAHYASNHKGVCLEYSTSKLDKNIIFPIIYTDKLPNILNYIVPQNNIKNIIPKGLMLYHCIHKLIDWSYEKEWRYIPNIFTPLIFLDTFSEKDRFINFIKPSKLILGSKIEDNYKNKLYELAHSQSIPITKLQITRYGLKEQLI
jgi:hypothetical protein